MLRWITAWWNRRRTGATKQARTGAEGERLARTFLQVKCGYTIVACNWRSPRDRRDEIDVVCRDGPVLVFVEVKTRAAEALVPGFYAVDRAKRKVMLRVCKDYLRRLSPRDRPETFRFDVVEVAGLGADPVVRHFENVALFPKNLRW